MKIYAINSNYFSSSKASNNSFTGYYDILREGAKTPIRDLGHAKNVLNDLMCSIESDNLIVKNKFFYAIKNICANTGLKELFSKFSKLGQENQTINDMIQILKKDNIVPIANNGFISVSDLSSLSGKPKDIHLGFSAGIRKGSIEFYADKKGDVFVDRSYGKICFSQGFYSDTGTKKVNIKSYEGGVPEKVYYNRDGSESFLKNLFLGGTPVEGIY